MRCGHVQHIAIWPTETTRRDLQYLREADFHVHVSLGRVSHDAGATPAGRPDTAFVVDTKTIGEGLGGKSKGKGIDEDPPVEEGACGGGVRISVNVVDEGIREVAGGSRESGSRDV